MKASMVKVSAATICLAFLGSCANIQDDGTRTRTEGTLTGAVLGGVAGAIIGNQSNRAWQGAAIGAAAGGLAGLAVGDHVARKKAGYASTEDWLDACIAQAEETNQQAVAYNNSLTNRIASLQRQIDAAKALSDANELRRIKQSVVALQKEASEKVTVVNTEITEQDKVIGQTGNSNLQNRVSELKSTRSSLQSNQERLADLGNQIDV